MAQSQPRIKEPFVAEAEDYTWLLCHSLVAAKTDPRGFQNQDVYQPRTQTNKMCVTEQNPEMLIFLFYCCIDGWWTISCLLFTTFTVCVCEREREREEAEIEIDTVKMLERKSERQRQREG